MEAILSTPELLEAILLAADAATILTRCQLVCRAWRDAIQESPSLQRHLFFLSEQPAKASVPPRKNQLLAQRFGFMFGDAPENGVASRESFNDLGLVRAKEAFARPEATWRRMHISQPATQMLSVLTLSSSIGGTVCKAEQVPRLSIEGDSSRDHEETTWRMADLYRYLWQYFVDNRVSSVRVWWGALPQEGIGLPGQESAVRDSRRVESREALEKLFYDNNQVVLVRKKTVQCVRGLKEKDRVFRDTYNMD